MNILLVNDRSDEILFFYKEIYRSFFNKVFTISSLDDFFIEKVSNESIEVKLGEISLNEMDVIHCLNFPRYNTDYFSTSKNELYKYAEYEASFYSALFLLKNKRIINKGFWLSSAKYVFDKYSFIKKLNSIGWKTPRIETRYNFNASDCIDKTYFPNPNYHCMLNLTLTAKDHFFDDIEKSKFVERNLYFKSLMTKTRELMIENDIDIFTLPLTVINDEVFLFGITYSIPSHVKIKTAKKIVRNIL